MNREITSSLGPRDSCLDFAVNLDKEELDIEETSYQQKETCCPFSFWAKILLEREKITSVKNYQID